MVVTTSSSLPCHPGAAFLLLPMSPGPWTEASTLHLAEPCLCECLTLEGASSAAPSTPLVNRWADKDCPEEETGTHSHICRPVFQRLHWGGVSGGRAGTLGVSRMLRTSCYSSKHCHLQQVQLLQVSMVGPGCPRSSLSPDWPDPLALPPLRPNALETWDATYFKCCHCDLHFSPYCPVFCIRDLVPAAGGVSEDLALLVAPWWTGSGERVRAVRDPLQHPHHWAGRGQARVGGDRQG
ncbi:hypothetical protein HPG69_016498 [Diceros bicornis minor]|uniref:Uncharacterized protein n=1 Tax=Diceros bicornis minor TaxID=77932 RepID=A0A7J7F4R6_DICBM|nr:hypothetical protein HPG69_016498 [Diceros bicornis minor]